MTSLGITRDFRYLKVLKLATFGFFGGSSAIILSTSSSKYSAYGALEIGWEGSVDFSSASVLISRCIFIFRIFLGGALASFVGTW
jgi:hypothetical protein